MWLLLLLLLPLMCSALHSPPSLIGPVNQAIEQTKGTGIEDAKHCFARCLPLYPPASTNYNIRMSIAILPAPLSAAPASKGATLHLGQQRGDHHVNAASHAQAPEQQR